MNVHAGVYIHISTYNSECCDSQKEITQNIAVITITVACKRKVSRVVSAE